VTAAITGKDLKPRQKALQTKYDKAATAFYSAQAALAKAKDELVAFNNKYSRVLTVLNED